MLFAHRTIIRQQADLVSFIHLNYPMLISYLYSERLVFVNLQIKQATQKFLEGI